MTTTVPAPATVGRPSLAVARRVAAIGIGALGTAFLAARPALVAHADRPTALLVALFVTLGIVGRAVPVPRVRATPALAPVTATTAGVAAVVAARLLTTGRAPGALGTMTVLLGTLAAVSEELWFRRFLHGLLEPGGTAFAVVGTAALFALVHVPVYGWGVLPLDLGAGLLLGWQRAASGTWGPSAVTHAVANALVLL